MDEILKFYLSCLKYDYEVFSQPWIYWWLFIPFSIYLCVFFMKWTILTAPIWLPFEIIFANKFKIIEINKEEQDKITKSKEETKGE